MDEICRLCCSTKFVNNDIFDEENALYLKMSLYLPIKVFKNDRLPRKVCDKCSCKVNDFYQFCNETIEVQNRLRSLFLSSEACINASIDLTLVKHSASPPPSQPVQCERSTQTDEPGAPPACEVTVQVKHEPDSVSLSPVKKEEDNYYHIDSDHFDDGSSGSDDISLISLKKKKSKGSTLNGVHATDKKARKKAANMKEWGELMESLPDATLTVVESGEPGMPLDSIKEEMLAEKPQDVFHCCTCFTQCYSRAEMVQHYRYHHAARGGGVGRGAARRAAAARHRPAALSALSEEGVSRRVGGALGAALGARPPPLLLRALREDLPRPAPDIQARHDAQAGGGRRGGARQQALRVRPVSRGLRLHALPAGAPHARAPGGGGAGTGAALRAVRARLRAHQLAAAPPARALGRAQLPVQRVRQGAVVARAPQVPRAHPHGLQAQRVRRVRQGLRQEVQPHAARARALGREAARVRALRQGLQPALHARHPRALPQRRAALRVRALRPRLRRQGAALHASQDHLHLAEHNGKRHAPRAEHIQTDVLDNIYCRVTSRAQVNLPLHTGTLHYYTSVIHVFKSWDLQLPYQYLPVFVTRSYRF